VTLLGRSLGALLVGALAGIVLSIGTDMRLRAAGVLRLLGKMNSPCLRRPTAPTTA
jgi:hypothetical protein